MEKTFKQVLRWAIIIPVVLLFYYVIVVTVVLPLWRWGILKQPGAINLNVLSVVGAVVGFLSIVLAIVFQFLSSFSGKRLESTVKEIESTLIKNNDLTEQIVHNQDSITKGLVETLGKIAQRTNAGETANQQPNNGWSQDFSR